ncbi:oligosaccharide flippase family protein [Prochlorococcus sp. MIT 1306]|uniref:oligosaccharide flippase family protein n=1 Tax=Prochlorococcus sp. MIT 1306 TaxID=1799667 RepID=UPI0007B32F98|nr:oligosaccharide flippase family protein [Prochlorococcus sp. MIT 1306]KZR66213.1 Polysaccharide biosynthesis protein [Prochlorococcus sp. MIT 1306]
MSINEEFKQEINQKSVGIIFFEGTITGLLVITVAMMLARFMTIDSYGLYTSSIALLTICSLFCNLGLPNVATRLYRSLLQYQNQYKQEVRGLNHSAPLMICLVSLTTLIIIFILRLADSRSGSILEMWGFAGILILLPLVCINSYLFNCANASGGGIRSNLIQGWAGQMLSIVTVLLAFFIIKPPLDVITVAGLHGSVLITQLVFLYLLLKKVEPQYLKTGTKIYKVKKWLKEGLPFSIAALGTSFFFSAGVVIVGFAMNDPQSAAKLSAASTFAGILISIDQGVFSIFFPLFVEATTLKNKAIIARLNKRWRRAWLLFSIPYLMINIIFGKTLLRVFGDEYVTAYPAMIILLIGYIVFVFGQPSQAVYQFSGNSVTFSKYTYVFAGVATAGMFIAGRSSPINGVAIISMLVLNARTLFVVLQSRKILRSWIT